MKRKYIDAVTSFEGLSYFADDINKWFTDGEVLPKIKLNKRDDLILNDRDNGSDLLRIFQTGFLWKLWQSSSFRKNKSGRCKRFVQQCS